MKFSSFHINLRPIKYSQFFPGIAEIMLSLNFKLALKHDAHVHKTGPGGTWSSFRVDIFQAFCYQRRNEGDSKQDMHCWDRCCGIQNSAWCLENRQAKGSKCYSGTRWSFSSFLDSMWTEAIPKGRLILPAGPVCTTVNPSNAVIFLCRLHPFFSPKVISHIFSLVPK